MLAHPTPQREALPVDELWSVEDVTVMFGITSRTVRGLVAEGRLPAYRIAGKRLLRFRSSTLWPCSCPSPPPLHQLGGDPWTTDTCPC